MSCLVFPITWALLLSPAQFEPTIEPAEERGTFFGVLVAPIPEPLYEHLPNLPKNEGVLVTSVLAKSPAQRAGLERYDILLTYDKNRIESTEHFARLIQKDEPNRQVKIGLLRRGKQITKTVTLDLGLALKLASTKDREDPATGSVAKPAPNPALSVSVKPLLGTDLRVTFEYYQDGTGRLKRLVLEGSLDELNKDIRQLPTSKQAFAQAVLERLRTMQALDPRTAPTP